MFIKLIAFSCLVATVACASSGPRRSQLITSASQVSPQQVAAPTTDAAKQAAQQAKLHYVEIGPSLKGDYKFGYDTGSGSAGQSFREETRLDDGTVRGAYGYIDTNGKQRIVKYTAGKAGFVVEGDQEAPGQSQPATPRVVAAPQEQAQPLQEARRPQPVALPQAPLAPAQPSFDEQAPSLAINRQAAPTQEDRARAEQQHAEQLRQHQLAQQAALAQQQRFAQQLQLREQQLAAAQQQSAAARQQAQPQFAAPQPQPQQQQQQLAPQAQSLFAPQQTPFGAAPQQHHQTVDPQTGQFFSSTTDANLNQLLANQLRQLQSGNHNQFAGQFQPPAPQQQQQQQQFAAQAPPAFQQGAPQFPAQGQINAPVDFNHLHARSARQTPQFNQQPQVPHHHQQNQQAHHAPATPQAALIALHQQQQHDAQILANLRAQQLAQLQQQQQQQPRQASSLQPQQFQPEAQPQPAPVPRGIAPVASLPQQPQQLPSGSAPTVGGAPQATPQEVFGPPVIDIRTLNYSIGQQTRV